MTQVLIRGSGIRDQDSGIRDGSEPPLAGARTPDYQPPLTGANTPDQASSQPPQEVHIDLNEPRFRLPSVVLATCGVLAVLVLAYLGYLLLPVLLLIFVSML